MEPMKENIPEKIKQDIAKNLSYVDDILNEMKEDDSPEQQALDILRLGALAKEESRLREELSYYEPFFIF